MYAHSMAWSVTKYRFQYTPCWVFRSADVFRHKKIVRRTQRHVVLAPNLRLINHSMVLPEVDIISLGKQKR